jgi:lysophospholipase L1-like esterase
MYRRAAIVVVIAAIFFAMGFLARPTLSRFKHRARVSLQKQTAGVQVIDVTHYERQTAHYGTYPNTHPVVLLGDSRIEWAEWSELLGRNDISNRGISGDTTAGVLARLPTSVPTVGIVCVIQLGVNDFFLGASIEQVIGNYGRIVDHLLQQKQARVIVTSIVLVRGDNAYLNEPITACNQQLASLAASAGATWLDLNATLSPNGYLAEEFSADGVHFNGRGYQTISRLIAPLLPSRDDAPQ